MKKTKKFTQAELDSAVRMARREGIHEGRLIEKRSEETKERHKKFYQECENIYEEAYKRTQERARRFGKKFHTTEQLHKITAVGFVFRLRKAQGEKP